MAVHPRDVDEQAETVSDFGITGRRILRWSRGQGDYGEDQRRLSELLRSIRVEAGLRQVDVAKALDEPQSFVSKYESGERRLDLVELKQVCMALGVPLVDLLASFLQAE